MSVSARDDAKQVSRRQISRRRPRACSRRAAKMVLLIADAQQIILSHAPSALPPEPRPPIHALGARLASDVATPRPHPPFPAAIKDGFAVAADAGAGTRNVVTASRAGASAEQPSLSPHQAAYVTTGAPMPPGTDAVVQIESCTDGDAASKSRANSASIDAATSREKQPRR